MVNSSELIPVAEKALEAIYIHFMTHHHRLPTPEELDSINDEFESRMVGYIWNKELEHKNAP